MWRHFLVTLAIIHTSVQQSCEYSCLSVSLNNDNCVENNKIKANARVHKTKGIVDFQFDFGCSVETYKILIFYNKSVCSDFEHHSTYRYNKIPYSNKTNSLFLDLVNKCSMTGMVFLQNIQTGCYVINILDQENNVLYDNITYWHTKYIRQKLDLLKTETRQTSKNNGTELIFIIENPILNSIPEFSLRFECNNCPEYMSKKYSYHLLRDETNLKKLILNPKYNKTHLNISCELDENKAGHTFASCNIFPVTVGYYNIAISFVGDPYKCAFNKPENHKIRIKNIVVKADELLQQPPSYFKAIIGTVLGVICILLLFSVVSLLIKLGKINVRTLNKINIEEHAIISLNEKETRPNLLLLYSRNPENIMTILSSLRNILIHQGIQVFDVYDPERLSEINEDNFNWILNLTPRKDIKIIIFLTPSARNLSSLPQMQSSVDNIYQFAIKHLLSRIANDPQFHRNIFVAHFSNDACNYSDYDLFCPHLRFRVPDDLTLLLQSILNIKYVSLNSKSKNEYNKLKKNYEKLGNILNHT